MKVRLHVLIEKHISADFVCCDNGTQMSGKGPRWLFNFFRLDVAWTENTKRDHRKSQYRTVPVIVQEIGKENTQVMFLK